MSHKELDPGAGAGDRGGGKRLLNRPIAVFSGWPYYRYSCTLVARKPANPYWSMDCCQPRNSSTVRRYLAQASSRVSSPPRTAATTSALRRITQRRVVGFGRSANVNGAPSGPRTIVSRSLRAYPISPIPFFVFRACAPCLDEPTEKV